jgi:hypothetical protein
MHIRIKSGNVELEYNNTNTKEDADPACISPKWRSSVDNEVLLGTIESMVKQVKSLKESEYDY